MLFGKVLRGVLVFILSFIFVSLLFATSSAFIFSKVTEESVIKPLISAVFSTIAPMGGQELEEMQQNLLSACEGEQEIEMPLGEEEKEGEAKEFITVNCEDIRQGKLLKDILFEYSFEKIYYVQLDCDFLDCLTQESEFPAIFSKSGNDFFNSIKHKLLITAIIVGFLLILVGGISIAAKNLIVAGLPLIPLFIGKNLFLQNLSGSKLQVFLPIVNAVIPLSIKIFSAFLIAGLILFVISFILSKRKKEVKEKPVKEMKPVKPVKPTEKKELGRVLKPIKAVSRQRAKQRKEAEKTKKLKRLERKGIKVIQPKKRK